MGWTTLRTQVVSIPLETPGRDTWPLSLSIANPGHRHQIRAARQWSSHYSCRSVLSRWWILAFLTPDSSHPLLCGSTAVASGSSYLTKSVHIVSSGIWRECVPEWWFYENYRQTEVYEKVRSAAGRSSWCMVFWHVTHDICRRRDACPWSGHTRGTHFLPHVLGIKRGRMIFVRGVSFLVWQNGLFVAYFDVNTGALRAFASVYRVVGNWLRGIVYAMAFTVVLSN